MATRGRDEVAQSLQGERSPRSARKGLDGIAHPDSAEVVTASMKTHTRTAAGTSSRSGYTSMSYVCAPSTRSRNGMGVPIAPERPALADVTAADRWRSSSPPSE